MVNLENNRIDAALYLRVQAALGQTRDIHAFASGEASVPISSRILLLGGHTGALCEALSDKAGIKAIRLENLLLDAPPAKDNEKPEKKEKRIAALVIAAIEVAEKSGAGWVLQGYPCGKEQADRIAQASILPDLILEAVLSPEALSAQLKQERSVLEEDEEAVVSYIPIYGHDRSSLWSQSLVL